MTTLVYDAAGQVVGRVDRDGRHTSFAYDLRGRQVAERWLDGSLAVLNTVTYAYDAAGQLTGVADGATALTYTYDDAGRQTAGGTSGQPAVTLATAYYDSGSRASLVDSLSPTGTTIYSYDPAFRLASVANTFSGSGQTIDFGHDAGGRLTSLSRHTRAGPLSFDSVGTGYAYDAADPLRSQGRPWPITLDDRVPFGPRSVGR